MSERPPADVCVVGAGPAGGILAASLAERGHDVVILEAGPRFDQDERTQQMEMGLRPQYDDRDIWSMGGERDAFTWSGDGSYALNARRIKGVGGTSLHWGGVTPRLHPEDFEMNSRYGLADDWPIDYDTLEPYYCRAEQEMGVSGEQYRFAGPRSEPYPLPAFPKSYSDGLFEAACSSLGIEVHRVPRAMNSQPYDGRSQCVGYGTCQIVCPSGGKYDASVHVERALQHGATLIDRAPVQRLVVDDTGTRVTAAVYVAPDGTERRQRAKTFVVACGAVESARLLLMSGDGREGLANRSGMVGRCLTLHPAVKVLAELDQPTRQNLIGFSTSMTEQFYDYGAGPEGSMILKFSNTAGPAPASAAMGHASDAANLARGDIGDVIEGNRWGDTFVDHYDPHSSRLGIMAWVEQLPDTENRVTLDRTETDDNGNPVPELSWRLDDRSRSALRHAVERCQNIFDELGATGIETYGTPDRPLLLSHRMGTTRMGTDPDRSVVRPDLRTHDVTNLYVSSGGTFVTAGAANPTLTIAALTLRLADQLHRRLQEAD